MLATVPWLQPSALVPELRLMQAPLWCRLQAPPLPQLWPRTTVPASEVLWRQPAWLDSAPQLDAAGRRLRPQAAVGLAWTSFATPLAAEEAAAETSGRELRTWIQGMRAHCR